MKGDKAAVRTLLQQKADVNAPQVDGATALHWAIYRDDAEMVDLLIRAGANVKAANRDGVTPLAMASLYGNPSMILEAAQGRRRRGRSRPERPDGADARGAQRQSRGDQGAASRAARTSTRGKPLRGTTALMWAVEQRHPAAVKALLAGGADFKAKSAGAGLPRNYLAPRVNTAAVKHAAERYARGRGGRPHVRRAARSGSARTVSSRGPPTIGEQLARLQQQEAAAAPPPRRRPGARQPPAASRGTRRAGSRRTRERGRARTAAGAGRGAAAAEDETDDSEVVVAGLVGSGGGGLTPLMFAAREGDLESAKLLLDAGADVNQTTEYGWTPLLTATNNRHYQLGKYLIERGADVNKANKGSWTPLYLATDNRNIEGGDYPVPKPDMDHLEYIKLLLEHGADPNARAKDNTLTRTIFTMQWFFEDGCTPFVRAAQSSDTALMKLLLDWGADPFIADGFRRHGADRGRRHRLGRRRHLRAVAEREPRSDQDARVSRPRRERRQQRRPDGADGRGA